MNSGEGLAVELRALRCRPGMVTALLVMLALFAGGNAAVTEGAAAVAWPTLAASDLDQAIVAELERPQYAWRMRREQRSEERQAGGLELFFRSLGETITKGVRAIMEWYDKAVEWLARREPTSPRRDRARLSWDTSLHWLVCALVAGAAAVLAVYLLRAWRRRRSRRRRPTWTART